MDDFQAATERFLTWFKSMGGDFRDDLIEIQDLRAKGAGRGISKFKRICRTKALRLIRKLPKPIYLRNAPYLQFLALP